jgi:hypothetical protein
MKDRLAAGMNFYPHIKKGKRKMNKELTHILIVADRSGSMVVSKEETENAINRVIEDQKQHDAKCNLTLVEFDDVYEEIFNGDIQNCPHYVLRPRGLTALNDAVGKSIATLGYRLSEMAEKDRPGLVIIAIATDGGENASNEYVHVQVKQMIQEQTDKYNWQFMFLGVDINAEQIGTGYGINNNIQVARSNTYQAYAVTSSKMSSARSGLLCGASMNAVVSDLSYTDAEKEDLK